MLAENPYAGRSRAELSAAVRSFPVGSYVIFYIPLPDGVDVIRVLNGRQDVGADDLN